MKLELINDNLYLNIEGHCVFVEEEWLPVFKNLTTPKLVEFLRENDFNEVDSKLLHKCGPLEISRAVKAYFSKNRGR